MTESYTVSEFAKSFLSLLEETLSIPSPSGREELMADFVCRKVEAMGYRPERDVTGNVLVRLEGQSPDASVCMLAAHLDEIGLVVTFIEPDGSLRVARSGGCSPERTGERVFTVLGDRGSIMAVVSLEHLKGKTAGDMTWDHALLLTGLSVDQLAEHGIRIGSQAVPSRESRGPLLFGNPAAPWIGAWTFDDRGGLLVQLLLLDEFRRRKLRPLHPTIVAFTVQEEQGCHGAKGLAHRERPDLFLAVDGCPRLPGSGVEVNARPVVWSKDLLATYDQRIVRLLAASAEASGTRIQSCVLTHSNSDASHVFSVGAARRIGLIGHARYNRHGYEVADLGVFENVCRTLEHFLTHAEW